MIKVLNRASCKSFVLDAPLAMTGSSSSSKYALLCIVNFSFPLSQAKQDGISKRGQLLVRLLWLSNMLASRKQPAKLSQL